MTEESGAKFKVTDRRTFRDVASTAGDEAAPGSGGSEPGGPGEAPSPGEARDNGRGRPPPPITFGTFALSLGTSALVHLGEIPENEGGEVRVDLELARQTIDLLGMLAEKTKGNLTREEDDMLRNLLTDLRMRFVAARHRS